MNLMQIIQMIKSGQNPQQLLLNFMTNNMTSSPLGQNILNLAQQGNTAEIEKIARNLCANTGKDFDKEFTAFKQNLGL